MKPEQKLYVRNGDKRVNISRVEPIGVREKGIKDTF